MAKGELYGICGTTELGKEAFTFKEGGPGRATHFCSYCRIQYRYGTTTTEYYNARLIKKASTAIQPRQEETTGRVEHFEM